MKPVVITVFDSEQRTTAKYTFEKSPIRIGRNPLNDLTLPFPFVSGWHAVVRFDEQQPRFFDLGSTNGTLYEGRRIQPGEPLNVSGLLSVTIGRLELRLVRGQEAPTRSSGTAPASGPPATPPGFSPTMPATSPAPPESAPAAMAAMAARVVPAPMSAQPVSAAGQLDSSHPPLPPAGPASPAADGTAHVPLGAVHEILARARPRYDALRQTAEQLVVELSAAIGAMPPALQQLAIPIFAREFPELAGLPQFADLATRVGARVPGAAGSTGDGLAAVQHLARRLRAEESPPGSPEEAARFLACVADVLIAGAGALIELQKGQEQFGNEMGVRVIKEFTPLHAAGTPENLLRYLLDWNKGGPHRVQELRGVYADLMIHQVALIRGVIEGVRSLIAHLDPREIERQLASAWPSKSTAAWKAYEKLWHTLSGSDRQITELVFGPEFARAYAEVGGEGGSEA